MLNKSHFYFESIKHYIVAMSHIFSDVYIQRTEADGTLVKNIKVPLTYSGKTKLYYKLQRDDDIKRRLSTILPRISFILESMERDSERSTLYSNTIVYTNDGIDEEFQWNPISYNFNFSVSIWSKYTDDILQIVEQICSFFDPDFNVTVWEIPELDLKKDIPIVLNSIDLQTDNEFDDDDDRIQTADLDFTLKGHIHKPISDSKLIKHITTNFLNGNNEEEIQKIEHIWNDINSEIDTIFTP